MLRFLQHGLPAAVVIFLTGASAGESKCWGFGVGESFRGIHELNKYCQYFSIDAVSTVIVASGKEG